MPVSLRQLTRHELVSLSTNGDPTSILMARVYPGALPPPFVVSRALARLKEGAPELWWIPFVIVRMSDSAVVGGCAFKGPQKTERFKCCTACPKVVGAGATHPAP